QCGLLEILCEIRTRRYLEQGERRRRSVDADRRSLSLSRRASRARAGSDCRLLRRSVLHVGRLAHLFAAQDGAFLSVRARKSSETCSQNDVMRLSWLLGAFQIVEGGFQ